MNPSLAKALLADRQPGVQLLYGVATATNTVEIAGSTVAVELPALQTVVAGDYVAVLAAGADRLILGPVGGVAGFQGTYTPTLTGMAIGTGGSAANTADWTFVGGPDVGDVGLMQIDWELIFGTSGATFPTSPTIELPAGFNFSPPINAAMPTGRVILSDSSDSTNNRYAELGPTSVSTWRVTLGGISAGTSALTTTTPFTWAAGDSMRGSLRFRAVRV